MIWGPLRSLALCQNPVGLLSIGSCQNLVGVQSVNLKALALKSGTLSIGGFESLREMCAKWS